MALSLMRWKNVYMIEKVTKIKNTMRGKSEDETIYSKSTKMDEGEGVINEIGGKDVDLD